LKGVRVHVRGAVQGVGFRPFVSGLASELGIAGFVTNSAQGAEIDVEGEGAVIDEFLVRMVAELPSPGFVAGMETSVHEPVGFTEFSIRDSGEGGSKTAVMLPDIATCPKCLKEMANPSDRRFRYPFINCTHCGPRYSILLRLPYDRPNTTMRGFAMCDACRAEYESPLDRRFHAQPIACPVCGPQIELWDAAGVPLGRREEALQQSAELLREGRILALKGIGGFHLMVDARNEDAVQRLRERKRRFAKPLALMVPSISEAREIAALSAADERLLGSPEAPIVLVSSLSAPVAPSVAPGNPNLGLMLPYSPLHHLLIQELGFPVVATSGNLSEEPICTDEREAIERFSGIADAMLVHDRPIARPVDDSVVRVMLDRSMVLRRGRGYAPLPVSLEGAKSGLIAVGAHLKNSVALSLDGAAVVGQHVGDLDNAASRDRMVTEIEDLCDLHGLVPAAVCHDLHPDYASTRYAESLGLPLFPVQHHVAHAAACLAENGIDEALAVVWDGTGYGTDGTIWGGEFFQVSLAGYKQVGRFRQFWLPGGDAAVREGRRAAMGLLQEAYGDDWDPKFRDWAKGAFDEKTLAGIRTMVRTGLTCVRTSSAGRLFDAFAAMGAGILKSRFEGDAAMRFEHLASRDEFGAYPFELGGVDGLVEVDWQPALAALGEDVQSGAAPGVISTRCHRGLADAAVALGERLGAENVLLSGGCFQNRLLLEETYRGFEARGVRCLVHQRIPTNDGGIAFGQLAATAMGWQ